MDYFVGMFYESDSSYEKNWEVFNQLENTINGNTRVLFEDFHEPYISLRVFSDKDTTNHTFFKNDRYLIVFTGKIDNIKQLNRELSEISEDHVEKSEAELLLNLYSVYKEKIVEKLQGMFAFLIWDCQDLQLFGARDHFGIKPLYYYETEDRTIVSTRKRSIFQLLDERPLDSEAIQHYMTFQFAPEPYTLTKGIKRLLPGHYFMKKHGDPLIIERYWRTTFQPVHKSTEQWERSIRDALIESVHNQVDQEESVGVFLSGGIDSTIIASLAKEVNPQLQSFSVGFRREGFSELDVVAETVDELGIENDSYLIEPEEFVKEIPRIMYYIDDPLADPACIPTYFLVRNAAKKVDVVLSGEGADELFAGYGIYREPQSLAIFQYLPKPVIQLLRWIARFIPEGVKGKSFIVRGTTPLEDRYIGNAKIFSEEDKKKLLPFYNDHVHFTDITRPLYSEIFDYSDITKMQYIDLNTWLNGDILPNVERLTNAFSLELRLPFLTLPVYNVASQIPDSLKIKRGQTKYILRKAAEGIIPEHVVNRKKLGFPVPIRHWLRHELYDWAVQIIKDSDTEKYINKRYVLWMLEEHRNGKMDYSRKIWTVLCFMIWHAVFMEKKYAIESDKPIGQLSV